MNTNTKPNLISNDMIDDIISKKNVYIYKTPSNTSNFQSFNNMLFICCSILLVLFFINKSLNYYNKHQASQMQRQAQHRIVNKPTVSANNNTDGYRPISTPYTEPFSQTIKKKLPENIKMNKLIKNAQMNNAQMNNAQMNNVQMNNAQMNNAQMNNAQSYTDNLRTEQQIPSNLNFSKTVDVNSEKNVYEQFNSVQSKEDQKQLSYEEIEKLRNQQNQEIGQSFENNQEIDLRDNAQYNVKKDNTMQNIQQEINSQKEIFSSNEVNSTPLGGDSLSFSYL